MTSGERGGGRVRRAIPAAEPLRQPGARMPVGGARASWPLPPCAVVCAAAHRDAIQEARPGRVDGSGCPHPWVATHGPHGLVDAVRGGAAGHGGDHARALAPLRV
eukprot:CAMPEP_0198698014 /NCGR_PEP_ID=MMETSP1468-20131203/330998_1 /TAXON_ID=1461545 /ORGANISM="Mantoniella sp, Strain CCMP1436" /LENGTH=104 /DNA_ID=CAMNT_0044454871 /DNA_START=16 /DNA_END=326 /DNA_ORIENTATION=+